MVQNGSSSGVTMPYNLRKFKENAATMVKTATTTTTTAASKRTSASNAGRLTSTAAAAACNVYTSSQSSSSSSSCYSLYSRSSSAASTTSTSSSICSSKSSTPSPSPSLMNGIESGNLQHSGKKHSTTTNTTVVKQQMMVKLCFDEPKPNTSLDSTVTASTLTDSINDQTVVEVDKVATVKPKPTPSVITTRSKLRRQLATRHVAPDSKSPSAFKTVLKSGKSSTTEPAKPSPMSDEDDDENDDDDDDEDNHHRHHPYNLPVSSSANAATVRHNKRPTDRLTTSIKVKKKKRSSLLPPSRVSKSAATNKDDYDEDDENSGEEEEDDDDDDYDESKPRAPKTGRTPPHKKFRKLRLFDTPHTPKTLIEKSTRLLGVATDKKAEPSPMKTSTTPAVRLKPKRVVTTPSPGKIDVEMTDPAPVVPQAPASSLRMRLFEDDRQSVMRSTLPNKALNFDDTDTDDMMPHQSNSDLGQTWSSKKTTTSCYNTTDCDDEMTSLFSSHQESTRSRRPPPTPLSSLKCKSVPVGSQTQGRLFKPISQSTHHQRNGSISSTSSTASSTYHINSPHTPFMCNQIHASVNPFTPTNHHNNHDSNKLARLAAANQELAAAGSSIDVTVDTSGGGAGLDTSRNSGTVSTTTQRLPIRHCLVSRYHEEFHEVCKLGSGEFGDVFKCINRLDGCTYAIKRSKKAIAGSALEISAWKEVCAHAVLVKHNHIVQYYSAWAEADRMLIQNEYCNGGSLAEFLDQLKQQNTTSDPGSSALMSETDLKTLLLHVGKGLAYMHSLNLAHLDIKPGNIFICRAPQPVRRTQTTTVVSKTITSESSGTSSAAAVVINEESGIESEEFDDDLDSEYDLNAARHAAATSNSTLFNEIITYKIGDLGHVTSTLDPHVEEGDCRYLPNEILQEQYDQLSKADIFALALTIFVCGSLQELPKNGDEWHWIRQGNLKDLPQCGDRFKKLLLQMVHENPSQRPSASTLVHHPCICPDSIKSKAQLRKELNQEKFKNEMLQRKVKKYEQAMSKCDSPFIKNLTGGGGGGSSRLLNIPGETQTTATTAAHYIQIKSVEFDPKANKFGRSLSSSNII